MFFTASGTFTWLTNSDASPVDVVTVTLQAPMAVVTGRRKHESRQRGAGAGELLYKFRTHAQERRLPSR